MQGVPAHMGPRKGPFPFCRAQSRARSPRPAVGRRVGRPLARWVPSRGHWHELLVPPLLPYWDQVVLANPKGVSVYLGFGVRFAGVAGFILLDAWGCPYCIFDCRYLLRSWNFLDVPRVLMVYVGIVV